MKKIFTVFISLLAFSPLFFISNISSATSDTPVESWWINLKGGCLDGMWSDCFNYEEMIWIADAGTKPTATSIAQDVFYAATYMVGTVLTIVVVYCGLMYILASRDWKDVNPYKKWLISAGIWALLVRWAYTIVRLVQYIAKW